jgi:DNA-binding Lrp family transcriptional regulator
MCLALEPESRLRDVAERVGITERAAQQIVRDLVEADVLTKQKVGRRNVYEVHGSSHLRHPLEQAATVGELVDLVRSRSSADR